MIITVIKCLIEVEKLTIDRLRLIMKQTLFQENYEGLSKTNNTHNTHGNVEK